MAPDLTSLAPLHSPAPASDLSPFRNRVSEQTHLAPIRAPGLNIALLAPSGTPAPILARLNAAMDRVMASPEVRARLNDLAIIPAVRSPDAFAAAAAAESATWRELIRARNIRVQ